ncbi:hypothetical protein TNCV_59461 [Trichonephila clavipes]|nr:hypothetical protein TNCV_59461 [Trichonephila clavipes]
MTGNHRRLQIQSVTQHSVSACTIRRHLKQIELSVRRPLLRLPWLENHRRLQIQSVTQHSVSACTIRRHLKQIELSVRRPLLRLP